MLGFVVAGGVAGLASTPHCAAMCGPLAVHACRDRNSGLKYGVARAFAYFATGSVAGGVGHAAVAFLEAPHARFLTSLLIAVGLGLGAYRLWRSEAGAPAVKPLVHLRRARTSAPRPVLIGAVTALLPCGALFAGLTLAAASGSAWIGGLTMFTFAVASSLGLVGAGLAANRFRRRGGRARKAVAVLLALGALIAVVRGVDGLRSDSAVCHASAR